MIFMFNTLSKNFQVTLWTSYLKYVWGTLRLFLFLHKLSKDWSTYSSVISLTVYHKVVIPLFHPTNNNLGGTFNFQLDSFCQGVKHAQVSSLNKILKKHEMWNQGICLSLTALFLLFITHFQREVPLHDPISSPRILYSQALFMSSWPQLSFTSRPDGKAGAVTRQGAGWERLSCKFRILAMFVPNER